MLLYKLHKINFPLFHSTKSVYNLKSFQIQFHSNFLKLNVQSNFSSQLISNFHSNYKQRNFHFNFKHSFYSHSIHLPEYEINSNNKWRFSRFVLGASLLLLDNTNTKEETGTLEVETKFKTDAQVLIESELNELLAEVK